MLIHFIIIIICFFLYPCFVQLKLPFHFSRFKDTTVTSERRSKVSPFEFNVLPCND